MALLLASTGLPAIALAETAEAPQELEPIIVTPPFKPLDTKERLRKMLGDDCKGCPPLIEVDRENVYLKIGGAVGWLTGYGLHVPEISHEDRIDLHLANDWRQVERLPEN